MWPSSRSNTASSTQTRVRSATRKSVALGSTDCPRETCDSTILPGMGVVTARTPISLEPSAAEGADTLLGGVEVGPRARGRRLARARRRAARRRAPRRAASRASRSRSRPRHARAPRARPTAPARGRRSRAPRGCHLPSPGRRGTWRSCARDRRCARRPRRRAPGSNVTVPVTLTTGVRPALSGRPNSSFERAAKAAE